MARSRTPSILSGCLILNLVYDLPTKSDVFTKKVYLHADHYKLLRAHIAGATNKMTQAAAVKQGVYMSDTVFSTPLTTISTENLIAVQNTGRYPTESR